MLYRAIVLDTGVGTTRVPREGFEALIDPRLKKLLIVHRH